MVYKATGDDCGNTAASGQLSYRNIIPRSHLWEKKKEGWKGGKVTLGLIIFLEIIVRLSGCFCSLVQLYYLAHVKVVTV